jgi:hypothetical protein
MIIVLVVVHVVLKPTFAIDHPKIGQIGSPQTQMVNARVGVGFLDGIFHLNHDGPPLLD